MYLLSLIVIVLLSFIFVSNRKTNQILHLILEGNEHDREIIMENQKSNTMTRKQKQIQKAKQRAKQMKQNQQKSS